MMRVLHSRQLLVRDDEQLPAIFAFGRGLLYNKIGYWLLIKMCYSSQRKGVSQPALLFPNI